MSLNEGLLRYSNVYLVPISEPLFSTSLIARWRAPSLTDGVVTNIVFSSKLQIMTSATTRQSWLWVCDAQTDIRVIIHLLR